MIRYQIVCDGAEVVKPTSGYEKSEGSRSGPYLDRDARKTSRTPFWWDGYHWVQIAAARRGLQRAREGRYGRVAGETYRLVEISYTGSFVTDGQSPQISERDVD